MTVTALFPIGTVHIGVPSAPLTTGLSTSLEATGATAAVALGGYFDLSLSGTWAGSAVLERSRDSGVTWHPVETYTANVESYGYQPVGGVVYRINWTRDSGTLVVLLSQ
jgi:hypothetical protein